MMEGLSDTNLMRIGIGVVAVIVFLVILFTSRSRQAPDPQDYAVAALRRHPPVAKPRPGPPTPGG